MNLYYIQDSDRPMWVIAANWLEAIEKWKAKIREENDGECDEPQGVQLICDEDELEDKNQSGKGLECAMCGATNAFVISPLDPAVGYCFKEQQAWRITSTTCATKGCLQPKATFGDYCMGCLEDRVNGQPTSDTGERSMSS